MLKYDNPRQASNGMNDHPALPAILGASDLEGDAADISGLEAIAIEARSLLSDEDDIQRWIDWLDEVCAVFNSITPSGLSQGQSIASVQTQTAVYSRAVRRLQLLCRNSGRLPSSCLLASEVVVEGDGEPYSKSAFSDIYFGRFGDMPVALKALRIHVDDKKKVERVRVTSYYELPCT